MIYCLVISSSKRIKLKSIVQHKLSPLKIVDIHQKMVKDVISGHHMKLKYYRHRFRLKFPPRLKIINENLSKVQMVFIFSAYGFYARTRTRVENT